jgi:phosphopantothenoylcysteine decarboxylase/phosphopantothenate--cysteine ligase
MYLEVKRLWPSAHIGVFAAAVADYKPKITSSEKIKKQNDSLLIELVRNPDSLAYAGKNKSLDQIIVGFALETNNEIENSKAKLISKNADIMVLNSLQDKGAGFESDTNKITILDANNNLSSFELKAKVEVAEDIVNYIEKYLK